MSKPLFNHSITQTFINLIATVVGVGYLPLAPGTYAALLAAFSWYEVAIHFSSFQNLQWILIVLVITAGVVSSGQMAKKWGKDPSQIVIDEVAGMWISLLLLPPKMSLIILAFILFRFFDIVKPLGIRRLEKLKGGWGIMADDVAAGIYANVVARLFYVLFNM